MVSEKPQPSKEDLLAEIARSEDWRAKAWLVERMDREPVVEKGKLDELADKRKARRAS